MKIPLPKIYIDMMPAKIRNVRFLTKIDVYVNSATEFAHLGHFGTKIRTIFENLRYFDNSATIIWVLIMWL